MSLIEINPDVKLLVKELKRIANALETYLLVAHDYRVTTADAAVLERGGVHDVSYASDEATIQEDIDVALKRKPSLDEMDEDDDVLH